MSNFRIIEHSIPCQHIREYPRALATASQETVLSLSVKQYIPLSNPSPSPGDVTIIGAHANGFPKELYEPLWDDLVARTNARGDGKGWRIRSIWIADVTHQGASGVVNEDVLGNDPSWLDHSRDLLHLVNVMREQMPRPIVGVGHSMGGAQLVNLSLMHPRLFTTLILIDPVIQKRTAEVVPDAASPSIARLSTFRRDVWPSLESAQSSFAKSPFYARWDKRVLSAWLSHGVRPVPTPSHPEEKPPQVTLTTTVSQEVFTFLRPNYEAYGVDGKKVDRNTHADLDTSLPNVSPFYRAESPAIFARLPEVRPSTLYLFGEISDTSRPEWNEEKLATTGVGVGGSGGRAEGRVKGVTFEGIGHLVAMEVPTKSAEEIDLWMGDELERWRAEQKRFEEWAKSKSLKDKQTFDEQWKTAIGGPPARVKKDSKM